MGEAEAVAASTQTLPPIIYLSRELYVNNKRKPENVKSRRPGDPPWHVGRPWRTLRAGETPESVPCRTWVGILTLLFVCLFVHTMGNRPVFCNPFYLGSAPHSSCADPQVAGTHVQNRWAKE
jgi:hypothetical protein